MFNSLGMLSTEIEILTQKRNEIAKPYIEEIKKHEDNIRESVLNQEKSFKCNFGNATFRKSYERASWDDKKLQGFSLVHPEILECRKVSFVDATVTIKTSD